MIETLFSTFKLVKKPIKKEQLLKTFSAVMSMTAEEIAPAIQEVLSVEKDKGLNKSKLLDNLCTLIKINKTTVTTKDFIKTLDRLYKDILSSQSEIQQLINKHLSAVLTDRSLSVKDSAIIKLVNDLMSMSLYTIDLLVCVLAENKDTSLPKIKFKQLKDDMPAYAELFAFYSKHLDKTIKDIAKLDDTSIEPEQNKTMTENMLKNKRNMLLLPSVHSFLNNPFYHIRMWLVDGDMDKVAKLKDERRLIELRVMELKLEQKNTGDRELEGRIAWYEDKLAKLEYDIQKLEQV